MTILGSALLLLLVGAGSPVASFTTSPPSMREYTTSLRSGRGTDFWGQPRDEGEIVDYIHNAVFGDDGRASSGPAGQDRWVEVISEEPPLVLVHGFLEHGHCDQIIDATLGPSSSDESGAEAAGKHRLKRSTMGNEQGTSDHRTSSTAWLREHRCPAPLRTFATRAAALSGLPTDNMENLQVVRYEPGEEFQMHTDHLDSFNDFDCGGRLCTCLVYLNDSETEAPETDGCPETFTGGQTVFPEFDASINPKKGSAIFFWNTLERPGSENYNDDMFLNVDMKTRHAGLPVLSGEKWVANRWIHPRSFGAGVRGL
ncbi:hypothetical protein ACHAWF_012217 [Thalassiosira exigua]